MPHVSLEMTPAAGGNSSSSDSVSSSSAAASAAAVASTDTATSTTATSSGSKNGGGSSGGSGHGHSGAHEEQQASAFWLATCFTMLMGSGILFGMVRSRGLFSAFLRGVECQKENKKSVVITMA